MAAACHRKWEPGTGGYSDYHEGEKRIAGEKGTSFSFKKIEFGPYREISRYFFSFEINRIVAVIKKSNLCKQCTSWIFYYDMLEEYSYYE